MTPEQQRALDFLRQAWPDKAREVEQLLAAADPQTAANLKISVGIHYKLEKFEGEYSPEKKPLETIEGDDTIGESR